MVRFDWYQNLFRTLMMIFSKYNVYPFCFIRELREQITPEIMELIKQQRLNYLVEGTRFTKYSKGQRMKGNAIQDWC